MRADASPTPVAPDIAAVVADVRVFAEFGAGFWRIRELPLPALDRLPSVVAAARAGGRSARFDALELALESGARALESPWCDVALLHLGFDTDDKRARHIRSLAAREDLAAEQLGYSGRTYRRDVSQPHDGRFKSWRIKTLTRVAEEVLAAEGGLTSSDTAIATSTIHRLAQTGIAAIYETQSEAEPEMLQLVQSCARLDILAIRGLGILALNDALLRRSLLASEQPKTIRVLFLRPGSGHAHARASETREAATGFSQGIRMGLIRMRELQQTSAHDIQVRIYDALPVWRIIAFDDVAFVSTYIPGWEGQNSQMFKIVPHELGVLHAAFSRMFNQMFDSVLPLSEDEELSMIENDRG